MICVNLPFVKDWRKQPGIYGLYNQTNGLVYIGSTCNLYERHHRHQSHLRNNEHRNQYLQRAFNKYGESCFEFQVLEYCEISQLQAKEEYWMAQTGCCNKKLGYNLDRIVNRKMHTEETKKKIGRSGAQNAMWGRRGALHPSYKKVWPESVRKKQSETRRGMPQPWKRVAVIGVQNGVETEYPSIKAAIAATGVCNTTIVCMCQGKLNGSRSRIKWRYKNA